MAYESQKPAILWRFKSGGSSQHPKTRVNECLARLDYHIEEFQRKCNEESKTLLTSSGSALRESFGGIFVSAFGFIFRIFED